MNLLYNSDFYDCLATDAGEQKFGEECSRLEKCLTDELKGMGELCDTFEKFKECLEKVNLDNEDRAVLAAFKLGFKIGMEVAQ